MSDTPRTDEAIRNSDGQWSYGLRETCEKLERELADAKEKATTAWSDNLILDSRNRQLERELAEARNILKQCLSIMPVGYVPTHTVENLPEMIGDLAKALAEETTEREQLERELTAMTQRRDELLASLEKVIKYLTISLPSSDE